MDRDTFESICRRGKCRILQKETTPYGDILLAERIQTDEQYPIAFYETMWAIDRDGVDVLRFVRSDIRAKVNGILRLTTEEERKQDALADAYQWIKDNIEVGRYAH